MRTAAAIFHHLLMKVIGKTEGQHGSDRNQPEKNVIHRSKIIKGFTIAKNMEINRKKQVKKKENQKGMNSSIHEKVAAIPYVFYDIAAINVKEREFII